jgi:hypothetical protein
MKKHQSNRPPSVFKLPNFTRKFQAKDSSKSKKGASRHRKFTPENFFHTIVQLVGGANLEGYDHALLKAFGFVKKVKSIPNKSSLCRKRQKVTYKFFATKFKKLIGDFEPLRQTFKGLRIYAIDGQQMTLPRTKDVVDHDFNGRAVSKYRESYLPRGYFTHAYDVLSHVTKGFCFGPALNEIADAKDLVKKFEQWSLTLYDRLFLCEGLVKLHFKFKSFFIFRCRRNHSTEIAKFFKEHTRRRKKITFAGFTIWLIKVWNSKTKEFDVFATNLPREWIKPKTIWSLYRLRWEVEISFLEFTSITKIEQWHSKFINGILQELYALLWLINYSKIQTLKWLKKPQNPLRARYQKPNFKLILNWILWVFHKILKRVRGVLAQLKILIKKSTETRQHLKRSYPRQIRGPASPYPYNNTLWEWEVRKS